MTIVCPDGMGEGDALLVTAPDGRDVEVVVPAGISAGDEFEVDVGVGESPAAAEGAFTHCPALAVTFLPFLLVLSL